MDCLGTWGRGYHRLYIRGTFQNVPCLLCTEVLCECVWLARPYWIQNGLDLLNIIVCFAYHLSYAIGINITSLEGNSVLEGRFVLAHVILFSGCHGTSIFWGPL